MSFWTHIVGVIHVDTYAKVDDVKKLVEDALKDAPEITGSEGPAAVFVNAEPGHNIWTSCDCGRCQYKDTISYLDRGFECDGPPDFVCPKGEYQSRAIMTVCGDLRNRMKRQTKKEWNEFHRFIAKKLKYGIRIATCRIDGY